MPSEGEAEPGDGATVFDDLVSVIIPAYNAAATLDETLVSVRSQTHVNLEILVVDDGSNDATKSIVAMHSRADGRVRLLSQANAGVAAARNHGIEKARGELIAPVDADDLWAPTKIAQQVAAFRRWPDALGLSYTWFTKIDEDGACTVADPDPATGEPMLHRLLRGNLIGNGSSALMRKSAIVEAGGYDASLRARRAQGCEDFLLYFRIAERHQVHCVPEYLTGYRQAQGAMSGDHLQMLRSYLIVADEMRVKYPGRVRDIQAGEVRFAMSAAWGELRARRLGGARAAFLTALGRRPILALALGAKLIWSFAVFHVRGPRARDEAFAETRFVIGQLSGGEPRPAAALRASEGALQA